MTDLTAARLVESVTWLLAAHSGALFFLWLRPGAAAAAEGHLGLEPIPFLHALVVVLLLSWGLLVVWPVQPAAEWMGKRRWRASLVVVFGSIAVLVAAAWGGAVAGWLVER